MGRRLPSAEEVLIIRPAGKKGQPPHRSNRVTPSLPEPCQEARAFQSRIRTQCGPVGNAVAAELQLKIPRKVIS
jgi:hypothetical protein